MAPFINLSEGDMTNSNNSNNSSKQISYLQLHLKRHEVIWTLSRLEKKKQQLKTLSTNGVNKLEVLKNES
jgi:hypothetical protein